MCVFRKEISPDKVEQLPSRLFDTICYGFVALMIWSILVEVALNSDEFSSSILAQFELFNHSLLFFAIAFGIFSAYYIPKMIEWTAQINFFVQGKTFEGRYSWGGGGTLMIPRGVLQEVVRHHGRIAVFWYLAVPYYILTLGIWFSLIFVSKAIIIAPVSLAVAFALHKVSYGWFFDDHQHNIFGDQAGYDNILKHQTIVTSLENIAARHGEEQDV